MASVASAPRAARDAVIAPVLAWRLRGRPVPPPEEYKRRLIRRVVKASGARVFVETGTWRGDTVAKIAPCVDRAITIELDQTLFEAARERFADTPTVEVILGDSGDVVGQLLPGLESPAVFWLDGHYSGPGTGLGTRETPIVAELEHLLAGADRRDVILIDDARLFGNAPDYPTIDEIETLVLDRWPDAAFTLQDDIVRVSPGPAGGR